MSTALPQLETVDLTVQDGVGRVTLNRPAALNAWNRQLGLDLRAAIQHVADDDEVRAVVVGGAGRAFSSGADLKDMSGREEELTASGRPDVYRTLTERYHPIITGIREMDKPVVAAVRGPAVGIGLSLALVCDLIVAAESAYFLLAFVNIGFVPDGGSSLFVPNRVGMARAAEMAMLGERVPAEQALQWGLINRVVPDDELDEAVQRARGAARRRADARLRGHQAPAQPLAVRAHGRAARARGPHPAGDGRDRRFRRGRERLRAEARNTLRGAMSAPPRGRASPVADAHEAAPASI